MENGTWRRATGSPGFSFRAGITGRPDYLTSYLKKAT
jgi:hypothetical protein